MRKNFRSNSLARGGAGEGRDDLSVWFDDFESCVPSLPWPFVSHPVGLVSEVPEMSLCPCRAV